MSIEDKLIRRQVFIQRFSASEARKLQETITRLYQSIQSRLLREPSASLEVRLINVRRDLDIIMQQGFNEMSEDLKQLAFDFSADESDFSLRAMQLETRVPLSVPGISQLQASLLDSALDIPIGPNTLSLLDALNEFTTGRANEIRLAIGDGVLLGETTPQISKRVAELASGRHKAQAESLVRTIVNHTASMARKSVTVNNSELFEADEWVAVLDSNTTLICGGRDGRLYPIGRGPYPPAHWQCRSVRVPVLKPEFDTIKDKAKRPQKGDKKGKVDRNTKFDGWLRGQPADFQDEYFSQFPDGLEKAALFRRGKLPIQAFRDETGRDFTLEQLRALEPIAFGLANIPPPT